MSQPNQPSIADALRDGAQVTAQVTIAPESGTQVIVAGGDEAITMRVRAARPGIVELVSSVFLPKQCGVALDVNGARGLLASGLAGLVRKVTMTGPEPTYVIWAQIDESDSGALLERRAGPRTRDLPSKGSAISVPGAGPVPGWAALLVTQGRLTVLELRRVALNARAQDKDLDELLVSSGVATRETIGMCMALDSSVPFVEPREFDINLLNRSLVPADFARAHGLFALFDLGGVITLGMEDPTDLALIDQVRLRTKRQVDPVLCPQESLRSLFARAYRGAPAPRRGTKSSVRRGTDERDQSDSATSNATIQLVQSIVSEAVQNGASDIHIEPEQDFARVRVRVDGMLHETSTYPSSQQAPIVSSIKVKAKMDIAETRRPQDGHFGLEIDGANVDVRVSTIPTIYGENVVMRLLRSDSSLGTLDDLGLPEQALASVRATLEQPNGMLLVTGPTGSGKTSTLYAALAHLNSIHRSIVTVEDPVERRVPLLRQTQINAKAGLTFASGLRSILRQDPDVIMVGEIRDLETAEIAVQAALTGHLVLSTLHTNTAADAIVRLSEMGIAPFLITSSLRAVVAQRLVRRVCESCAESVRPDQRMLDGLGMRDASSVDFRRGKGCARCLRTGYRGRIGVYEILEITPSLSAALLGGADRTQIEAEAAASIAGGLREDGLDKVRAGLTTLEEVARVAGLATLSPTHPRN